MISKCAVALRILQNVRVHSTANVRGQFPYLEGFLSDPHVSGIVLNQKNLVHVQVFIDACRHHLDEVLAW